MSFLDAGENRIFLTQIIDADQESLIKPSMEGLTYAEIFGLLAPGRPVPEALKRATDRFSMGTAIGSRDPNAGQAETSAVPGALAKSAGQWDLWFQQKRATVPEDSIGLKDMEKDRNGDHVAYLNVRFSGVRTYETIVAFIRAVALLERERITGFLENASRKRGAVGFRITHDEAEARDWLSAGS